jgi:hypothetical protein
MRNQRNSMLAVSEERQRLNAEGDQKMAYSRSMVTTAQVLSPDFHGIHNRDEVASDQRPSEQPQDPRCQDEIDAWARHANASNGFG